MNIKILTFVRAHNYGAFLQAFALSEKLKKEKHNVEFVDYRVEKIENAYKPLNLKTISIRSFLRYVRYFLPFNKKYYNFNKEIKKIQLTKSVYDMHGVETLNNDTEVYITGSDQVWNKNIVGELSNIYSLNFNSGRALKVSYAASVGDSNLIIDNKEEYREKLSSIDHISVREEDAKEKLEEVLNRKIDVVLDPTLLLEREDWEKYISNYHAENKKYIFAYVVAPDSEYIKIVNSLSERTGLPVIHCELKNPGYNNVLKTIYTKGPFDFVSSLKNAEYVVATSFHATVFSILFHKKFFIIPHRKTGARVTNLLGKLGIEGRTFSNLEEFKNVDYDFETDWSKIDKNLSYQRQESIKWLENAIKN